MSPIAKTTPGATLLKPDVHFLMMIDFQSQMFFATKSIDAIMLRNNAGLIASSASGFKVPTILTTVTEKSFSGPMLDEIAEAFENPSAIDRESMNAWEDDAVVRRINEIGRGRVVICGRWTSVCLVGPGLSALDQGFEVYVIADACGDVSEEAHERAMDRMVQAGARPMTALQYVLELQRDWSRAATYDLTTGIAKTFGGAYGIGIVYAEHALSASEAH